MSENNDIGVGLVGYGAIGRLHTLCFQMLPIVYPSLAPRARIVAVATASEESAARARRELGDSIFTTTDVDALIAHPGVAIVDCCAPTGDHARIAAATLRAGKHLFCEKPLTGSAADSAEIVALARARGIACGINYHFRQIPAIQEARRRIAGGLLGEVRSFHMRYYRSSNLRRDRPATWRFVGTGSGVLLDLGSHLIDLTFHLLGPIARVAARTRTVVGERPGAGGAPVTIESDDIAWLQIELAGGGFGAIEASKLVPGAGDDLRIEAYGERGAFTFDARDPNGVEIVEGGDGSGTARRLATLSRITPAAALPSAETPVGILQPHLASIAGFLTSDPSWPTLADGLAVDRVIDAALQSAREGGIWVEVAESASPRYHEAEE
jgi:predicted dehydrogenase